MYYCFSTLPLFYVSLKLSSLGCWH